MYTFEWYFSTWQFHRELLSIDFCVVFVFGAMKFRQIFASTLFSFPLHNDVGKIKQV